MRISHSRKAARIIAVCTAVMLISVMLTQLALAGTPVGGSPAQQGSGKQPAQTGPRPSSPSAYALYGDTVNTLGTNQTTMQTDWGLDGYASWEFYGAGTSSTGAALGGFAYNATHGIGVWGDAPKGTGVKGTSTDLNTFGVQGISDSGIGVEGRSNNADAVKGTSTNQHGVHGISTNYDGVRGESTNDTGVYGKTVKGNGVWGVTTQGGSGVFAQNFSTGWGALGQSDGGKGVEGDGYTYGLYGRTWPTSTSGYGVLGYSPTYLGVYGSGKYWGIYGSATTTVTTSSYAGVYGNAYYVPGVYGFSSNNAGVYGKSSASYGVSGFSSNGIGVYGTSTNSFGVEGSSSSHYGVAGISTSSTGLRGLSTSSYGGYMSSNTGTGLYATVTNNTVALRAVNPNKTAGYYAILADGNVLVNGTMKATGGYSSPFNSSQGDRLVYADQSASRVVSDQGNAMLKNGHAVVKIDPLYAQSVSLDAGYQVFVTPHSADTAGLAVINDGAGSFEVVELAKGTGSFKFDWRITAPRRGLEKVRLEQAPAAPPDNASGAMLAPINVDTRVDTGEPARPQLP